MSKEDTCVAYDPVMWFLGDMDQCLLTTDMELRIEQNTDSTKFQLGEPMSFTGLLTEIYGKEGIIYKGENEPDNCDHQSSHQHGDLCIL